MARRAFLHVGTMKSGTSYVQRLLWRHREELADRGLLVPGEREYDHLYAALVVRDGADRLADRLSRRQRGAWESILAETAATNGDAIISSEIFCPADPERAREALRRLGEAAEEVHVVLTTRDLARVLPSAWQQRIRQGRGQTWERFWKSVSTEGPDGNFHRRYDVPGILERWTPGLPPDRVHVVVHPQQDAPRDWVWLRMCEITGTDPTGLATDVEGSNESLGLAEVEVLRTVNSSLRKLRPERRAVETARFVRQNLVDEVLVTTGGERFVAPPEARAWACEKGRSDADRLAAGGWHVVGDLADLVPEPVRPGRTPDDVTSAEIAEVALTSLFHEVVRGFDQDQEIRQLRKEVRRLRARSPSGSVHRLGRYLGALGRPSQPPAAEEPQVLAVDVD